MCFIVSDKYRFKDLIAEPHCLSKFCWKNKQTESCSVVGHKGHVICLRAAFWGMSHGTAARTGREVRLLCEIMVIEVALPDKGGRGELRHAFNHIHIVPRGK